MCGIIYYVDKIKNFWDSGFNDFEVTKKLIELGVTVEQASFYLKRAHLRFD